jgi:hypothetical protein
MTPEQLDAQARNRFLLLSLLRIGGAVLVLLGVVIAYGRVAAVPPVAGYVLVAAGFLDLAILPRWLGRRWRTPPDA